MNKQWNHIIHDRLKDFPKKAPEGLLDSIKSEMNHRGLKAAPVSNEPQPRFPMVIRRIAAVAAIFLLLFGLGYQWTKHTDTDTTLVPIAENQKKINEVSTEPKTIVTENKTVAMATPHFSRRKEKISENTVESDTITSHITKEKPLLQEEQPTDQKQKKEKPVYKKKTKENQQPLLASVSKRKGSSLSAGIYYSGSIVQISGSGEEMLMCDNMPTVPEPEKPSIPTNLTEKEHHQLPIRFGLSIRYNINNRWNIQSGLTYSYLASDLSKSNQQVSYQTKQKLHYVGIPLQAGFRIWSSSRFNGYITAGGQVEKLISGKATTDYSENKKHQSTSTQKIHDKKPLFSALASVGVEYALNKHLYMYAEPGIHYYFKNGNGLKTTYNEHPLYFNITAGIRFNWNK